jgi:hypothetical protein
MGLVRYFTKTESTKFTDANIKALLNLYYHEFVNEILKSGSDIDFNMATESINLTNGTAVYSITGKVLRIKKIDISFDGSKWYSATNFDIAERSRPLDTTSIAADFTKTNPFIDLYLDNETVKIAIYPTPDANVTAGLKVWKTLEITELSAQGDEPSIPEAYQKYLVYGACRDYFLKKEMFTKATEMEKEMFKTLQRAISFYANRNEEERFLLEDGYGNNFCK